MSNGIGFPKDIKRAIFGILGVSFVQIRHTRRRTATVRFFMHDTRTKITILLFLSGLLPFEYAKVEGSCMFKMEMLVCSGISPDGLQWCS